MNYDVLIVGSGAAGLSLAVKVAELDPMLSVCVLNKTDDENCSTAMAQGGMAAVMDGGHDSVQSHLEDTLTSGKAICNRSVARTVVTEAPERIEELLRWGAQLDRWPDGKLHLGLEGGHSVPRVVHARDQTGRELIRVLKERVKAYPNVVVRNNSMAVKLLVEKAAANGVGQCLGTRVIDTHNKTMASYLAKATVLATGGSGQLFENTTNPLCATGDGIALAANALAEISNMQYIQFHPTALYERGKNPKFLISEAVRGYGAHLVDENGCRFLLDEDPRGELATRDVVSNAVFKQMAISEKPHVYMDLRHLDQDGFSREFPKINHYLRELGFCPDKDLVPVMPVAHYQCGGITVNLRGQTSLSQLYAIGECANTGLHGANRLASNSLIEALVFATYLAKDIVCSIRQLPGPAGEPDEIHFAADSAEDRELTEIKGQLKKVMSNYPLVRNNNGLLHGKLASVDWLACQCNKLMAGHFFNTEFHEFNNMLMTARTILFHALPVQENKHSILYNTEKTIYDEPAKI